MKQNNKKFIIKDGGKSLENLVKLGENATSSRKKNSGALGIISSLVRKKSEK